MLIKSSGLNSGLKEFFSFRINPDCIEWRGEHIFFLRVHPKNMTILSYDEKLTELKKFQSFLDSSGASFSIFVTDKTENLNDISDYYKKQLDLRPDYAFILEPVIRKISSIEQSSACVQRAFYIVFKARDRKEFEIFSKQLSEKIDFVLAEKEELITVMRNFILREYTPFDLYVFENALKEHYEQSVKEAKINRRVPENPLRESREDSLVAIEKLTVNNESEVNRNESSGQPSERLWGRS